jgi:hypothetical protein
MFFENSTITLLQTFITLPPSLQIIILLSQQFYLSVLPSFLSIYLHLSILSYSTSFAPCLSFLYSSHLLLLLSYCVPISSLCVSCHHSCPLPSYLSFTLKQIRFVSLAA